MRIICICTSNNEMLNFQVLQTTPTPTPSRLHFLSDLRETQDRVLGGFRRPHGDANGNIGLFVPWLVSAHMSLRESIGLREYEPNINL